MTRGKPLKRKAPMRASSPPRPGTAAYDADRQARLERALRPSKPNRRAEKNPLARGWTQRVFTLYGRYCLACKRAGRTTTDGRPVRAAHAHHAVARQTIAKAPLLSQEQRDALEYDARNGVPLCTGCHDESPSSGLRRSVLPTGVVEWAREHGFEDYVDRVYGPGGR